MPNVTLYVGGQAGSIQGEPVSLGGTRCFSAIEHPRRSYSPHKSGDAVRVLLDSGAFSDKPEKRLSFAGALDRQFKWEDDSRRLWECPNWNVEAVASYDFLLIDEVWEAGARRKQRWPAEAGWSAVEVSIQAAEYITSRRESLQPRSIVLGCQGVTAQQYITCAAELLKLSKPGDWFGFGGRCILGRKPSLLQEHYITALAIVPMAAKAGLKRVHIYGVLYERALAPLAWLAHQYGLELSTDSSKPLLDFTRGNPKKAGLRADTWRGNVAWWIDHLAKIDQSKWYRNPAELLKPRQLSLFEVA